MQEKNMAIPTESIGSIPRPAVLLDAIAQFRQGKLSSDKLVTLYEAALRDTIACLEATGSPVVSDGEQTKSSFATYPLLNLTNIAADGLTIPFEDGHTRQLPKLTSGPFKYGIYAGSYVQAAKRFAHKPIKQAVISASALSLLYPAEGITGYPREAFVSDLIIDSAL